MRLVHLVHFEAKIQEWKLHFSLSLTVVLMLCVALVAKMNVARLMVAPFRGTVA